MASKRNESVSWLKITTITKYLASISDREHRNSNDRFLVYPLKANFHSKYLILVKKYPLSIQNIHFFYFFSKDFQRWSKITFLSSIRHWIVQFDPMKSRLINLDFVRLQMNLKFLRFQTFVEFLNKILEGLITYFTKVHDSEIWTALKNHFLNIQQNNTAKYQKCTKIPLESV